MKYTIEGFNQEYALSLVSQEDVGGKAVTRRVDCTDLVLIRWFVDYYPFMPKMTVEGKEYAVLSYKKFAEDMPLIGLERRAFADRIKKLSDFSVLEHMTYKVGGSFALLTFGPNYKHLVERPNADEGCTKNAGGVQSTAQGVCSQLRNKDYSINYSINNNISKSDSAESQQSGESDFERFYKAYPKHKNKGDAEKAFRKLKGVNIEVLLNAIEQQKQSKSWQKDDGQFIPYPATWLNKRAWEDENDETATPSKNQKPTVGDKVEYPPKSGHYVSADRLPILVANEQKHISGRLIPNPYNAGAMIPQGIVEYYRQVINGEL